MSPLTITNLLAALSFATLGAAAPSPVPVPGPSTDAATVSGNAWALSCGSTCADVATVATGDWATGTQTCYNFETPYSMCWLNITEQLVSYGEVYGWISEGADCEATAAEETTFNVGECADVTAYQSYIIVLEV